MQNTLSIVKKIFERQFLIHVGHLSKRLYLTKDLDLTEYEQMEMLYYLENEFKINIGDQDILNILTVGDLIQCVENLSHK